MIKFVPLVPRSHPFIERLIGTVRRELLDHVPFWHAADLKRKLWQFRNYHNVARVHHSLGGVTRVLTPAPKTADPPVLPHTAGNLTAGDYTSCRSPLD